MGNKLTAKNMKTHALAHPKPALHPANNNISVTNAALSAHAAIATRLRKKAGRDAGESGKDCRPRA